MNTVILITAGCLYLAGIIIAAGDAWADEQHERTQAHRATMEPIRAGSVRRMQAAKRRFHWAPLWPILLVQALWRLRHETTPRHAPTTTGRHR